MKPYIRNWFDSLILLQNTKINLGSTVIPERVMGKLILINCHIISKSETECYIKRGLQRCEMKAILSVFLSNIFSVFKFFTNWYNPYNIQQMRIAMSVFHEQLPEFKKLISTSTRIPFSLTTSFRYWNVHTQFSAGRHRQRRDYHLAFSMTSCLCIHSLK